LSNGYTVELSSGAKRQYSKFKPDLQARLDKALDKLAANPRPPGTRKLEGQDNMWRIRVGDYRIVYSIYEGRLVVLVVAIAHRREVYD
jgi:mRNA interferase RelE/StbE